MPSLTTTHFKHLPFPLCDDLCLALHLAVQFAGDLSTFEVCSKLVRGKLKGFVCMLAATEDMKKPVMWHRHQYSLYELPPFRERKKKTHQSNKKKRLYSIRDGLSVRASCAWSGKPILYCQKHTFTAASEGNIIVAMGDRGRGLIRERRLCLLLIVMLTRYLCVNWFHFYHVGFVDKVRFPLLSFSDSSKIVF